MGRHPHMTTLQTNYRSWPLQLYIKQAFCFNLQDLFRFFFNFLFFNCYNFLFNFSFNFLFFKCYNMQLNTVLAIATITVLANCNYHGLGVLNVNMQDRYVRMRLILTFWNTHSSLRTSTIYVTPYHYFSYIFNNMTN